MRETEMEVLLCETEKNPKTDGYERDGRWYCWGMLARVS